MTTLSELARTSLAVIQSGQHPSGAYTASPTFPVYGYSWLRDGAFTADAASRAGDVAGAERFFGWCSKILVDRRELVESLLARRQRGHQLGQDEFLPTRYTLEGADSSEEWWNFQLDGYGTWLWALGAHCRRHQRSPDRFAAGAALSAAYISEFWRWPCYDWWEEHPGEVHTSTLGALAAGLRAACDLNVLRPDVVSSARATIAAIEQAITTRGTRGGRLVKWLDGTGIDASLISLATPFEIIPPGGEVMAATVAGLEAGIAHGGVHRYPEDTFYGGGEWVLLAAMLGWHYKRCGREEDAWRQLEWVANQADARCHLPEQVSDHLLAPDQFEPWVARWGPPARPLLWSHAMFLTLAIELGAVSSPVVLD